jgi:hypothetical protein
MHKLHKILPSLHKILINARREGFEGFEENPEYPTGIPVDGLLKILREENYARLVFIPADLVKDSTTAQNMKRTGITLKDRYVVYRAFRRGVGHDSTYG